MSCRGQTNCKRAVKPHRPKVEPIRNPTLFEMERLEDTATLPNTVTPDRPYSLPGILLGTSSFTAAGWEGSFNPQGMRSTEYLAFYAERFQTVEIDSTFYGCPIPRTVSNWAARTQTINPKTILDAAYVGFACVGLGSTSGAIAAEAHSKIPRQFWVLWLINSRRRGKRR